MPEPAWNLLQVSDVLDLEMLSALAEDVPVLGWEPLRLWRPGRIRLGAEAERLTQVLGGEGTGPRFRVRQLPLLRGFSRAPLRWLARTGTGVLRRLLEANPEPEKTPLICTVPYFASVAESWPGPVVYWLTDLIAAYRGADRRQVIALDRRMARASTLLCPNSQRLADYLVREAGADPSRIVILPNATRASNVLPAPPASPGPRPQMLQHIPGPLAGVIGNLAGNLDWLLLRQAVEQTPWLHWVFVGPATMQIPESAARAARQALQQHPRAHFVGRQAYGELAAFARALDVAVLPYRRCEPTFSGSSTRFYEHLAACRPMIATPGLHELTSKQPLLRLVHTAEQAVAALEELRSQGFEDGLAEERWKGSLRGTWQARARTLRVALAEREAAKN